jgi:hypothetical protein
MTYNIFVDIPYAFIFVINNDIERITYNIFVDYTLCLYYNYFFFFFL